LGGIFELLCANYYFLAISAEEKAVYKMSNDMFSVCICTTCHSVRGKGYVFLCSAESFVSLHVAVAWPDVQKWTSTP